MTNKRTNRNSPEYMDALAAGALAEIARDERDSIGSAYAKLSPEEANSAALRDIGASGQIIMICDMLRNIVIVIVCMLLAFFGITLIIGIALTIGML